ncbi:hypothetical protein IWQ62_002074 [Dispira parvispora]|uniref:Uncharacterized protein n=1 Tax=Dispira parvispora TaxID=1520584 RepID=A0A9W8AR54_9FUNG|nr:hypothetical protein IWQ62_002074 [Dispira parvispora]
MPENNKDSSTTTGSSEFVQDFIAEVKSHQQTSTATHHGDQTSNGVPTSQPFGSTKSESTTSPAVSPPRILPRKYQQELTDLRQKDLSLYYQQLKIISEESCIHWVAEQRKCEATTPWFKRFLCEKHQAAFRQCFEKNLEQIKQELGDTSNLK